MGLFTRTCLAWFNLIHNPWRLLTSLAGVAFAVLLMLSFSGFKNALYDSQVRLVNRLNAEIVMINRLRDNAFVARSFSRRQLYQAQSAAGVQEVYPFYTGIATWKNPTTFEVRGLRLLAFNPAEPVLLMPEVIAQAAGLHLPETVLMDDRSRQEIGSTQAGTVTELADRTVRISGTFRLGTDFFAPNGNLIMSDQNFQRYTGRSLSAIDIGLIKLTDPTHADTVAAALQQQLPDVLFLTKAQFVQRELTYWRNNSNIGFVFNLLTITGFIVGIVLVYQILYTDVSDHWAEYATLKAMGYRNRYLLGVILQEATLLSVLGFIPGFGLGLLLYRMTAAATSLSFQLTGARSIGMFGLTFAMCLSAGVIAVHKVQTADPATVFG
jgi:putative ABC transport system permease protein